MGDGEKEGDMVVREEGAPPVVVGGDLRLAVTGDSVNAGARGPLEAGVRPLRDRVQVLEVESLQERAVACIIGARSSLVRRLGH